MDIKKRIQELSLDQKAKLYFMGLVRQGKIDTLPEDPKAAYVSMMMDKDDYGRSISGKDKRTFMEPEDSMPAARARKLAGMAEGKLHEEVENFSIEVSDDGEDAFLTGNSGEYSAWVEDGIASFSVEYNGYDLEGYDEDNIKDFLGPKHAFVQLSNKVPVKFSIQDDDVVEIEVKVEDLKKLEQITGLKKETNDPEDDEMETRYDYDDPVFESLKEIATELGYLNENEPTVFDDESMDKLLDIISKYVEDPDDAQAELDRFDQGGFDALSNMVAANLDRDPEYKAWYNKLHSINESKVDISYTDPGFRFYKMKVDGKRLDREEGTEYLKGLGIDMEIPRSYDKSILDKIVAQLKEKGIDADHDAAMDVS